MSLRACLLTVGLIVVGAGDARAFVKACHQGVTVEALDVVGWPNGQSPPAASAQERHIVHEASIDIPQRARNPWAISMLLGNQYNDQGHHDLKDLVALAQFAARPETQRDHCLRGPTDDGENGSRTALGACKAFMLEEVRLALGDGATPDLAALEEVKLHLVFRGSIDVPLNRYAFHMGRASHALQDSFTHTFRTPDLARVRTVLNWVDWLHGEPDYEEARDGFQHLSPLDDCDSGSKGGPERRATAHEATVEFLAAVSDDAGGRSGRLARAEEVLDRWLALEPGCTADNGWCGAPEVDQKPGFFGCAVVTGRAERSGLLLLLVAAVVALGFRRRQWPLAAVLIVGLVSNASAEDVKGGIVPKATPAEQVRLEARPLGAVIRGGFALDNAAANGGVGIRYDFGKIFTAGLDVEYNPWISIEQRRTAPGTTNVYATGIYRLGVRDYLELRITAGLGISILNFDTFAARKGSVGPYASISPLGVAFRMGSRWRFIVDPAELVFAVPQPRGIPLAYRQHRFSLGLQANF